MLLLAQRKPSPSPAPSTDCCYSAAHEVLTSPEALDHLLAHLKKEGRIVAFGAKLSNSRRGRLGNLLIRLLYSDLVAGIERSS